MKSQPERDAQAVTIATAIALFVGVLAVGVLAVVGVRAVTGNDADVELLAQWTVVAAAVVGLSYLAFHRR